MSTTTSPFAGANLRRDEALAQERAMLEQVAQEPGHQGVEARMRLAFSHAIGDAIAAEILKGTEFQDLFNGLASALSVGLFELIRNIQVKVGDKAAQQTLEFILVNTSAATAHFLSIADDPEKAIHVTMVRTAAGFTEMPEGQPS